MRHAYSRLTRSMSGGGVESAADGSFRVGHLGTGRYEVHVDPPPQFLPPEPVEAAAGTTDVRVVLRAGATCVIRVVDVAGRPVAGAVVSAVEEAADEEAGPPLPMELLEAFGADGEATASDGTLRLGGLRPERRYVLTVRPPQARADLSRIVRKGWSPGDTKVTLPAGLSISGTVRDPKGGPVRDATVTAHGADGRQVGARTNTDGAFRFSGLAEGTYRLVVDLSDDGPFGMPLAPHAPDSQPKGTPVAAGTAGVVLVLDPGVELLVRVENWAERSNRRHALATLTGSDEDDMNAEVSSSGRVRVRWLSAAATYTLWIPPDADGRYVLARNLRPGGPEVAVRLAVGRTVTGRITDAARFERLDVHANGPGWTLNGTIKDGTFTLVGVPEATGTITAQGNVGGDGWIGTAPIKPDASPTIALKREGPHAFREPGSESLPEDGLTK